MAAAQRKNLKTMVFPPEFKKPVDTRKVNVGIVKKWMVEKLTELLGYEDEMYINYACELLDDTSHFPNIKVLQEQLTPVMEKKAATFCKELWEMMLSAQDTPSGVPPQLVEAKKREILAAGKVPSSGKSKSEGTTGILKSRGDGQGAREQGRVDLRQQDREYRGAQRNADHNSGYGDGRGYISQGGRGYNHNRRVCRNDDNNRRNRDRYKPKYRRCSLTRSRSPRRAYSPHDRRENSRPSRRRGSSHERASSLSRRSPAQEDTRGYAEYSPSHISRRNSSDASRRPTPG